MRRLISRHSENPGLIKSPLPRGKVLHAHGAGRLGLRPQGAGIGGETAFLHRQNSRFQGATSSGRDSAWDFSAVRHVNSLDRLTIERAYFGAYSQIGLTRYCLGTAPVPDGPKNSACNGYTNWLRAFKRRPRLQVAALMITRLSPKATLVSQVKFRVLPFEADPM